MRDLRLFLIEDWYIFTSFLGLLFDPKNDIHRQAYFMTKISRVQSKFESFFSLKIS